MKIDNNMNMQKSNHTGMTTERTAPAMAKIVTTATNASIT
jgi:hypothetical protein